MKISINIPDGTKAVSFTYVFSDWYKGDQIGASLFDTDDLFDGADLKVPREKKGGDRK